MHTTRPNLGCSEPAIALWLQSTPPAGRVAELHAQQSASQCTIEKFARLARNRTSRASASNQSLFNW
jgi:hypothetical protein